MKNLASHQAKRSAAAALPAAGRRSKSKGQKTKAVRWCIKSCVASAGVALVGSCSIHVQDERRTSCRFTATGYATPP